MNYTAFIELNDLMMNDLMMNDLMMNDLMMNEFYQNSEYKTWNGFRLLAIDGGRLQLPISKEIIEIFGCSKNNHETKQPASPPIS